MKTHKFSNVYTMSNPKTRAQRIKEKRQVIIENTKYNKRIKFREKALNFIEWRQGRNPP